MFIRQLLKIQAPDRKHYEFLQICDALQTKKYPNTHNSIA